MSEIDALAERGINLDGRLLISDRAHLVLAHHKQMDLAMEKLRGGDALGTTSRGIGPAYGDKYRRTGLRAIDLMHPQLFAKKLGSSLNAWNAILERAEMEPVDVEKSVEEITTIAERLKPYIADTTAILLEAHAAGRPILLEGAQGFGLDVDHGSYPYVTSSSTGPAGISAGCGLPPTALDRVLGVVKAYTTRVGAGPMPTRADKASSDHLGRVGNEFGSTTGRPRDCAWFDAVLAKRAAATQGVTGMALMKLDVLSGLPEVLLCTSYELDGKRVDAPPASAEDWERCVPVYVRFPGWTEDLGGVRNFEDLPAAAQEYVRAVQTEVGVPIEMISVGAERERFIALDEGVPQPV